MEFSNDQPYQTSVAQQWLRVRTLLLQPKRCLLANRGVYNAFFMDLPVLSFVFHSSLLIVKACDDFLGITEITYIFCSGHRGAFQTVPASYCYVTGRSIKNASLLDDN